MEGDKIDENGKGAIACSTPRKLTMVEIERIALSISVICGNATGINEERYQRQI